MSGVALVGFQDIPTLFHVFPWFRECHAQWQQRSTFPVLLFLNGSECLVCFLRNRTYLFDHSLGVYLFLGWVVAAISTIFMFFLHLRHELFTPFLQRTGLRFQYTNEGEQTYDLTGVMKGTQCNALNGYFI
jgi:hypothetical protein